MANIDSIRNDAVRILLAQSVNKAVTDLAALKLAGAGQGLNSEAHLHALATKVADVAVPALMANFWAAGDRIAKASGSGKVHVTIDQDELATAMIQSLDMVVKGESVAITFDGLELLTVELAKANGPAPTVQVDVHVPPAQVVVDNHIPQQAAPVVHVHPTAVVQAPAAPTTSRIEYGPDGKPKAIHRTAG